MSSTSNKPSPMRVLRAWLSRERTVRGPCAIELDVAANLVAREEQAIATATVEARGLEGAFNAFRQKIHAYLTDAKTPGVIDEDEAEDLTRDVILGRTQATTHTQTLEALS